MGIEGFRAPEDNTKHPRKKARMWRPTGVDRPWHVGRDMSRNPGSPELLLIVVKKRHTAIEARKGNLETELGWSLPFMTMVAVTQGVRLLRHEGETRRQG